MLKTIIILIIVIVCIVLSPILVIFIAEMISGQSDSVIFDKALFITEYYKIVGIIIAATIGYLFADRLTILREERKQRKYIFRIKQQLVQICDILNKLENIPKNKMLRKQEASRLALEDTWISIKRVLERNFEIQADLSTQFLSLFAEFEKCQSRLFAPPSFNLDINELNKLKELAKEMESKL